MKVKIIWSSWNTEIITNYRDETEVKDIEDYIRFLIRTNKKHGIDYLRIKHFKNNS